MGFFDALNDTLQLMKNTFVVIGKNKAIFRPTITQIWLGITFYLCVIASGVAIYFSTGFIQLMGIIFLIIFLFLLIPIFPFIRMYYRAAQCWIVYNTFTGKNITYQEGLARAKQNKGDIFILGLFDILLTALAKKLKQGTGRGGLWVILNIFMWLIGKAVEEGWDLIGHYLLPATIIQEKNVGQVLPEIKNLKNNVPGALAGVFGFDFAGDLIRGYITFFMFLFVAAGVATGIYLKNWTVLVIIIILIIALNMLIKIFVGMVKTVYFTLFYVSITMPMKIVPEYRQEVTHYLLHQSSPQSSKPQETSEQKINKLIPYIRQYRTQGYTDAKIQSFLVKNGGGWPQNIVNEALKRK